MATSTIDFLRNPSEIRKAVTNLQGKEWERLDLAVAFVGADWQALLSNHRGNLRLICWLKSTNTDPRAVEGLMKRPNTEVRQRDRMHCKVYLSPGIAAVVGSANLSKAALADGDNVGQDEAAVLVTQPVAISAVGSWFDALWKETRPITPSDLSDAKNAYDNAGQARLRHDVGSTLETQLHPDNVMLAANRAALGIRKVSTYGLSNVACRSQESMNYDATCWTLSGRGEADRGRAPRQESGPFQRGFY